MARLNVKRTPSPAEDEDEGDASVASIKRIKLERQERALPLEETPPSSADDPQPSAGFDDDDMSDVSSDADVPQFTEQEMEEAIERARSKKHIGQASEAGIIKSITLVNFMCHAHFTTQLGSQMNFIVGHNGSGKSAILTAIAVALGGKAAVTGRGASMKNLVRKNTDRAVITLTIANKGIEAYQPDKYLDGIVVERTIDSKGSGGVKFISERDGKIISRKAKELSDILQNFNITVDSPLTILTQDQARSFLVSADDKALYQFFLKGTALQSLSEDYEKLKEQQESIAISTAKQREAIPAMEDSLERLRRKREASQMVFKLKEKRARLKHQQAWAFVTEKEIVVDEYRTKVEETEEKLAAIEQRKEKDQQEYDQKQGELEHLQEVNNGHANEEIQLKRELKVWEGKIKAAVDQVQEVEENIRNSQAEVESSKKERDDLNRKLRERAARAGAEDPKLTGLRERFRKIGEGQERFRREVPSRQAKVDRLTQDVEKARQAMADADREVNFAKTTVNDLGQRVLNLQSQAGDRLAAYGYKLNVIFEEINRARWVHSKPLGPLGQYIQLEDPSYRRAFASTLGMIACAFAVKDPRDKATMSKVMRAAWDRGYRPWASASQMPTIITHSGELFDFRNGDLSHLAPTILSKLTCSNEEVLRILVVQRNVEKTFVSPSVKDFPELVPRLLRDVASCQIISADGFSGNGMRVRTPRGYTEGSGPMVPWSGNPLFHKDIAAETVNVQRQKEEATQQWEGRRQELTQKTEALRQLERDLAGERRGLDTAKTALRRFEGEFNETKETLDGMASADFGGDELALQACEQRLTDSEKQIKELLGQKAGFEAVVKDLRTKQAELAAAYDALGPDREKRNKAVAVVVERRATLKGNLTHWNKSIDNARQHLERNKLALEAHEKDLENYTSKASAYCPERCHNRDSELKTAAEVEAEVKACDKALAEQEKRVGPVHDTDINALAAGEIRLREAKENVKMLDGLVKIMRHSLVIRQAWWNEIRQLNAVRARGQFSWHMGKRNFDGRLEFDHTVEELRIRVASSQSATQAGVSQGPRWKNTKALSGGERSYCTVSLLLALWETASSPVRCLDEWDVFLDHMNRTVAAKMLIEGSKESDGKQYVLITPQDMSAVNINDPTVKVIRMGDPQRNQSTINFGRA